MAAAFDVGQKRGEHPAGAALGSGYLDLAVADRVHQPLGLLVQMVGESGLERLAQPRSPFFGGGAVSEVAGAGAALVRSAAD